MTAIIVALTIVIIGLLSASYLCKGKSKKGKYMIWGITIMIAIAPFLSFSIGLTYAFIVRNTWAALIMWCLFPVMFLVGLIVLFVGIAKEKEAV
ncbi:hypothetical protein [Priestia koreensis]|uniref:hypothetical protein n=1 Tax=Priestia koreensis TaxID=284581 RepID=UPI001F587C8A|nr:hypothetical protein [Priestia koreensis]MCM3005546.1 hypothetical protein [Priestia koreensis]